MNTPGATVEIKQVEISGNYASGSGGGIQNEGMLDFYEGMISQNQAHLFGGGIFNSAEIRLGELKIGLNLSGPGYDGFVGCGGRGGCANIEGISPSGGGLYNKGNARLDTVDIDRKPNRKWRIYKMLGAYVWMLSYLRRAWRQRRGDIQFWLAGDPSQRYSAQPHGNWRHGKRKPGNFERQRWQRRGDLFIRQIDRGRDRGEREPDRVGVFRKRVRGKRRRAGGVKGTSS